MRGHLPSFKRLKMVGNYYTKAAANALSAKFGKDAPFKIGTFKRIAVQNRRKFPFPQIRWVQKWFDWATNETSVGIGVCMLAFCVLLVLFFGVEVGPQNLWTEFWGLIFDIFFIVILLGIFQHKRQEKLDKKRQLEIIEDLKFWVSDEAKHRILGAIRRLNRMGYSEIDLSGIVLENAHLHEHGVSTLRGAVLGGHRGWQTTVRTSTFKNVTFDNIDCREITVSNGGWWGFKGAKLIDCSFVEIHLDDAKFDGAEITWIQEPEEDLFIDGGVDDDGRPITHRIDGSGFYNSELSGASFRKCKFLNADFRGASGISSANFYLAEGLETCVFDDENLKETVIEMSRNMPT